MSATRDAVARPAPANAPAQAGAAPDVRCPHCGKKLGETLAGKLIATCPRCKRRVTITR